MMKSPAVSNDRALPSQCTAIGSAPAPVSALGSSAIDRRCSLRGVAGGPTLSPAVGASTPLSSASSCSSPGAVAGANSCPAQKDPSSVEPSGMEGIPGTISPSGSASMFQERSAWCLLAVPKKGRLSEATTRLLRGCGLSFHRDTRKDVATCTNMNVAIIFLNAVDIPKFVARGNVEMGITGLDQVQEIAEDDCEVLSTLGFGKCRLAVQVPVEFTGGLAQLLGKKVVTSFPRLTEKFFDKIAKAHNYPHSPSVDLLVLSGSVEVSLRLGLGAAVVDLLETGETMRSAGLKEIATITTTEAALVQSRRAAGQTQELRDILRKRIDGYVAGLNFVYLSYNAMEVLLPPLLALTPGKRSPNIVRLVEEGWVAVTALAPAKNIQDLLDKLEKLGAIDMLVFPLASFRPGEVSVAERLVSELSPGPNALKATGFPS
eukprot:GHVT01079440.1.p1 GENE.GHVT01079440.1~~GHVT01079440.1.p1  ORF type:complete len:432 (+),score=90.77 GHVT01079440.1:414-1709(+)